ncbi:MAG: hypothetical protein ACLFSK_05300, partial [Ectothiorhodospira sp.]
AEQAGNFASWQFAAVENRPSTVPDFGGSLSARISSSVQIRMRSRRGSGSALGQFECKVGQRRAVPRAFRDEQGVHQGECFAPVLCLAFHDRLYVRFLVRSIIAHKVFIIIYLRHCAALLCPVS